MSKKLFLLGLFLMAGLVACGSAVRSEPDMGLIEEPPMMDGDAGFYDGEAGLAVGIVEIESDMAAAEPMPVDGLERQDGVTSGGVVQAQVERIIIKDAYLSVIVDDVPGIVETISRRAETLGGFVVSSNMYETSQGYGDNYQVDKAANLIVRIPADRLNDVLVEIRDMAVEVPNENISSQDITREYTDIESRLRNLEATRVQLEAVMTDARRTEDVLNVLNELTRITGEIEVLQGQLNYYSEAAALSAIHIDISPNFDEIPVTVPSWSPLGTARRSIERLVRSLQNLADFLIEFTIEALPFLLVVGVPAALGVRAWLRRRKAKKDAEGAAVAAVPPEESS